MCCYLTALFQTEEAESYFWSSLNQKLWLFTKAAPQDIKTVFGNMCDKKKKKERKKETNRKNELGSPCNWAERASCCSPCFFKSHCFCISHLLLYETVHKISNCQANHSWESDPLFGRDLSPLNILFYWCYRKKLKIHKESTVVIVKTQVLCKEHWPRSYNMPTSTRGWH